jgi:hypothetical protein
MAGDDISQRVLDDATIDRALARVADAHERIDDAKWRGTIVTAGKSFRMFLHRGGGFVRIELSPFLHVPEDPPAALRLYRELLARNRTLMEARFSLADDGDAIIESVLDDRSPENALSSAIDAVIAAAEAHFSALRP